MHPGDIYYYNATIPIHYIALTRAFLSKPCSLMELVEDCGPLPLANDKCKLDTERTNKSASFPSCCPRFACEDGVQLEYPEVAAASAVATEASAEKQ